MPTFRYRALTEAGEIVSGALSAPNAAEVAQRIAHLGLIPIETAAEAARGARRAPRASLMFSRAARRGSHHFHCATSRCCCAPARASTTRWRCSPPTPISAACAPTIAALAASILSGESFGEALAKRPDVFPPIYVALVQVGEASGTLAPDSRGAGPERQRAEVLRRRLVDALRYPAFLLLAAGGVMLFFLSFVLPQFADVFRDFNAKLDPVLATFLALSDSLRSHMESLSIGAVAFVLALGLSLRQPVARGAADRRARPVAAGEADARILSHESVLSKSRPAAVERRSASREPTYPQRNHDGGRWVHTVVAYDRQGPAGRETFGSVDGLTGLAGHGGEDVAARRGFGQLPMLSGRVADFYEAKLQRSLDRMLGIVGPLAIMFVSAIVGGLIVSVMTALISVNEVVN